MKEVILSSVLNLLLEFVIVFMSTLNFFCCSSQLPRALLWLFIVEKSDQIFIGISSTDFQLELFDVINIKHLYKIVVLWMEPILIIIASFAYTPPNGELNHSLT